MTETRCACGGYTDFRSQKYDPTVGWFFQRFVCNSCGKDTTELRPAPLPRFEGFGSSSFRDEKVFEAYPRTRSVR